MSEKIVKTLQYFLGEGATGGTQNLANPTSPCTMQCKTDLCRKRSVCKIVKGLNDLLNLSRFYLQSVEAYHDQTIHVMAPTEQNTPLGTTGGASLRGGEYLQTLQWGVLFVFCFYLQPLQVETYKPF